MKPSTRQPTAAVNSRRLKTSAGNAKQVSTLYLAAALATATLGLLLVAMMGGPAAAAAASKSAERAQVVAGGGGRPSSSAAASSPPSASSSLSSPAPSAATHNVAQDKEPHQRRHDDDVDADHHLALPSSTTSARLVPVGRAESSSARTSSTRSTDLSIGQSNIANAKIHVSPKDMSTAAGHHYGKSHGKYYMYAESPKKGAYKMGFKRGNHKHVIERKESAHKGHVHGYFKWHDKKGKGSHKWELKHYDKKGKHHHY
jgi:hypothetical protein